MNTHVIIIFILLWSFSILASTIQTILSKQQSPELDSYISGQASVTFNKFITFIFAWFLLLGNFIPISLIISLEMIKFFQGKMIQSDYNMQSKETLQFAASNSSNLVEQLGMVTHIFSDKTGTLTCNKMKFKSLSVGTQCFGVDNITETINTQSKQLKLYNIPKDLADQYKNTVDFYDQSILTEITKDKKLFSLSMLCLSLCHDLVIETKQGVMHYNSSSPDELALVNFVRFIGKYEFSEKNNQTNEFKVRRYLNNSFTEYKDLQFENILTLEFTNDRKRMSVIVRDTQTNQYLLFCKGADNVIFDRISKTSFDSLFD